MELKEKFFLVVIGNFEREPIEFDHYPSQEEITNAINELNGQSARVEKRYLLKNKNEAAN